jgi:hypothetical protein
MRFSETSDAANWINQFDPADRADAAAILDAMLLVGMEALIDAVRAMILDSASKFDGFVGLYVERELKRHKGKPKPLFSEMKVSGETRIRAVGDGPKPVVTQARDPEVGSEGILSWLVTELCRGHPEKFLSHPGPDQIRNKKVRAFFLVTDFLGSGKRTSDYLNAAWVVRSIKSWHSGKQTSFHVFAYSGTTKGIERVQKTRALPEVSIVKACPTIDTSFPRRASHLKALCGRYDPISNHPKWSLGFDGVGALIAFSHGCPNNVPRILFASKVGHHWMPLFSGRVTATSRKEFARSEKQLEDYKAKLLRMGDRRMADSPWLSRLTDDGRVMLIVLTALRCGPRHDHALSARTGLSIPEIRSVIAIAESLNWISDFRKLTDEGINELEQARKRENKQGTLSKADKSLYLPTSLRMP